MEPITSLKIGQLKKVNDKYFAKVKYSPGGFVQLPKFKIHEPLQSNGYSSFEIFNGNGRYMLLLKKMLQDIDTKVIDEITNNCEKWFNKQLSLEMVTNMYQQVQFDNNFKVFVDDPIVENHKKELIELGDISPGDNIECIIKIKYLVFTQDSCYLTWELVKVKKCQVKIKRVKKYGFIDQDSCSDSDPEFEVNENQIKERYSFF